MRIFFVRHGQSVNNALWDASGVRHVRIEDPELTELGHRQSSCVANYLAELDERFTHVYCSLMLRAVQTGEYIARTLGLPLESWVDLHEVGGMYVHDEAQNDACLERSGKGRSYFDVHHPTLVLPSGLTDAGWWLQPFEDERARSARSARVWQALAGWRGRSDETLILVTHVGFYNKVLSVLAGIHDSDGLWFRLNNAGVTCLDVSKHIEIAYMNCTEFMPDGWMS